MVISILVFIISIVIVGGITRLTGSGLSMVDCSFLVFYAVDGFPVVRFFILSKSPQFTYKNSNMILSNLVIFFGNIYIVLLPVGLG